MCMHFIFLSVVSCLFPRVLSKLTLEIKKMQMLFLLHR